MHLKILSPQVFLFHERTGAPQKLLRLRQQRCKTPHCNFAISCTSCNRPRAPGRTGGTPATSCPTNSVDSSAAQKMHCECKKGKELRRVRGGKGRCVCSSPAAVSDADTRRPARRELPTVTRRLAIGRSSAEVVFSKVRAAGLVVLGAEHRAAAMEPSSGPAGAAKPERRVRLGNLRANIA